MNKRELSEVACQEILKRFALMQKISETNTAAIKSFLGLPKKQRLRKTKPDGSEITLLDLENNMRSAKMYFEEFPDDGFHGEEMPMLEKNAEFHLLEDPVDGTNHALHYDPAEPGKKRWATHLLTLLYHGEPVAYTLGVPLRDELYSGNIVTGTLIGHIPYCIPNASRGFVVGMNEAEHEDQLMEVCGYKKVPMAGLCGWLILQGVTSGGINPFPLPHESACIAAIARCAGAPVTNMFGRPFQPYNREGGMIWVFDEKIVNQVRTHLRLAP
jgi:fructose-1,6-bisphosphatase/inositol monophosphatase family enzyme